jgi:4-amino-4-deoxy-L-arabinose transferase-like glycosyltransferase
MLTLGLLILHLWVIGHLDLSADEAYYAWWAQHLDWGYLDHPPMVALWIRASTALFGEAEFGIRALSAFGLSLGAALVYYIAATLLDDRTTALGAVMLYNSMVLLQAVGVIVTPDTPLLMFWNLALLGLALLWRTREARWWWLVGIASGLGLQSKYTALFLGLTVVLAMLVIPSLRRWWRHPAPYLAAALAALLFLPVVWWNAGHGWASFLKQFGRVSGGEFTLVFLVEYASGLLGLMNPAIFVLAGCGIVLALSRHQDRYREPRLLLVLASLPLLAYFVWHSLHERVQANWAAAVYPPLAILAAVAASRSGDLAPRWQQPAVRLAQLAVPLGLLLTVAVTVQAVWAPWKSRGPYDPTLQVAGWHQLARDVEQAAANNGANYILTSGYALTSLLAYYGARPTINSRRPVIQFNERVRWISASAPPPELFRATGLYVTTARYNVVEQLGNRFAIVRQIPNLTRARGDLPFEDYFVYVLDGAKGNVLDEPN